MTTVTMKMKLVRLLCFCLAHHVVQGFVFPTTPSAISSSVTTPFARQGQSHLNSASTSGPSIDASSPTTTAKGGSPGMLEIQSHADWMELMFDDYDDDDSLCSTSKITAVFFHAKWCKFCQRFRLYWNRQIRLTGCTKANFASVEYTSNRKLCQSLDIQHFPTVQFYYQGDLLHSAPCSPKEFSSVKQKLDLFVEMDEDQLEEQVELWAAQPEGMDSLAP